MGQYFVLYDPRCGLCRSIKTWLDNEPALVRLTMIPAGSDEASRRFPGLTLVAPPGELTVVGNDGSVYLGDRAWILCLWALRDYRDWAQRLSSPLLRPLARQAFAMLSRNRHLVSEWFGLKSDADLAIRLGESPEVCE